MICVSFHDGRFQELKKCTAYVIKQAARSDCVPACFRVCAVVTCHRAFRSWYIPYRMTALPSLRAASPALQGV